MTGFPDISLELQARGDGYRHGYRTARDRWFMWGVVSVRSRVPHDGRVVVDVRAPNAGTAKEPPHVRLFNRDTVKVNIQWEPRDLWVGLFWRRTELALHVYLCLVPCFPFHVSILRARWRT